MKLTIALLIITAFALYFSYQRVPPTRHTTPLEAPSSNVPLQTLQPDSNSQTPAFPSHKLQQQQDSIHLQLALEDALKVARPVLQSANFTTSYFVTTPDSAEKVYIEISIGPLLHNDQQCLLLRRSYTRTDDTYLDLYAIDEEKLKPLLYHLQNDMSYQSDTIFDVNGDQQADFVIFWYPTAGNWRRDIRTVYLNNTAQQTFSTAYTFVNPKFDPTTGIIRGIEYGNPESSGFYKYQWKGFVLDTIAYLYPHPIQKGKYIQVPNEGYIEHLDQGLLLDSLPAEYKIVHDFGY